MRIQTAALTLDRKQCSKEPMNIDTTQNDDFATLTLKGEFDTFHCPRFQEEVGSILQRGLSFIILDMRLVKFINSTALGAIIKASKLCKADNGELVLSQPSAFVRDILSKLGIDSLIPVFDSEEQARKYVIKALNAKELTGAAQLREEKVLISFPDDTRNSQIGGKKALVGTMSNVDSGQVQFLWSGHKLNLSPEQAQTLFFKDGEIHLKFQVKLIRKAHFEVEAKVTQTALAADDHVRVTAQFTKIRDEEQAALSQFAADMDFLKKLLPEL